jgi:hypothetical protein
MSFLKEDSGGLTINQIASNFKIITLIFILFNKQEIQLIITKLDIFFFTYLSALCSFLLKDYSIRFLYL